MLYKISWQCTALADLQAIRCYLEEFSFEAADRILGEVVDQANKLEKFPFRCPKFKGEVRRLVVGDYSVFFDIVSKGPLVRILYVYHHSRDVKRLL